MTKFIIEKTNDFNCNTKIKKYYRETFEQIYKLKRRFAIQTLQFKKKP